MLKDLTRTISPGVFVTVVIGVVLQIVVLIATKHNIIAKHRRFASQIVIL
jgi:hypothetical protein